ncbi:hypothetical protein KKG41_01990 [Patescibacteria group bacterium]|nr:hypothetical protein [Patescibacteria group bacterium]MBU1890429.1 hypothetical protein [Patescibacteria group bacterium]
MKRAIYILLAIILGLVVSIGLHALAEMWYLNWAENTGHEVVWSKYFGLGGCALPIYLQYGLFALGIVGGYLLGRWWWKLVYIEGRYWRHKRN